MVLGRDNTMGRFSIGIDRVQIHLFVYKERSLSSRHKELDLRQADTGVASAFTRRRL